MVKPTQVNSVKSVLKTYVLIFIIGISYSTNAQSTKDLTPYKIWINGTDKVEGLLYNATDSSVFVITNISQNDPKPTEYLIKDIKTLKIRRVNNIKKGAIWGLSIGAVSGVIIGANTITSEGSKIGSILATTAIFTTIGALAGVLTTAPKKVYISHTNLDYYLRFYKAKLVPKTIKAQGF